MTSEQISELQAYMQVIQSFATKRSQRYSYEIEQKMTTNHAAPDLIRLEEKQIEELEMNVQILQSAAYYAGIINQNAYQIVIRIISKEELEYLAFLLKAVKKFEFTVPNFESYVQSNNFQIPNIDLEAYCSERGVKEAKEAKNEAEEVSKDVEFINMPALKVNQYGAPMLPQIEKE